MREAITDKDARYDELFTAEHEADALGTMLLDDPHRQFSQMLARGPVLPGSAAECMGLPATAAGAMYVPGFDYYTAVSFAAVSDAFTNKDGCFSSQFYYDMGVDKHFGDSILNMDGLRHRRYRDLIQPFFQPAQASSWWNDKVIISAVDHLISAFEKNGRADLNADFFARLPMHVVTAAFGLSPGEGLEFRHQMQGAMRHNASEAARAQCGKAAAAVLETVIRARQAEPQDDLVSRLTQAKVREDDGSTRLLTVREILTFCQLIVFAGGGTTWRQLGITTFALLNHPEQLEDVKKNRSLLSNAVLESTRWEPTDPLFPRKVIKDTVLQGVPLAKGTALHVCLGAANRDPSRWENPDRFDIHRPIQRSVAFGAGAHSCLGQHVARQEIFVALNGLFDRLPNLRWDDTKPPARLTGGLIGRGPGPLHVVFG
jgi:cytochrome P450